MPVTIDPLSKRVTSVPDRPKSGLDELRDFGIDPTGLEEVDPEEAPPTYPGLDLSDLEEIEETPASAPTDQQKRQAFEATGGEQTFLERFYSNIGPVARGLGSAGEETGNFIFNAGLRGIALIPGMEGADELADRNNRLMEAKRAYDENLNKTGDVAALLGPEVANGLGTVSQVVGESVLLGGAGRATKLANTPKDMAKLMATAYGLKRADQELTRARDLFPEDKFMQVAHPVMMGGLEGLFTRVGSALGEKFGLEGAEEIMSRNIGRAVTGLFNRSGLTKAMAGAALEGGEEATIEAAQIMWGAATGSDTTDEALGRVSKAFAGGAITRGALGAGSRALQALQQARADLPDTIRGTIEAQNAKAEGREPFIPTQESTAFRAAVESESLALAEIDAEVAKRMAPPIATPDIPLVELEGGTHAFHGTPHTVDQFSTEKIGTGEGNQAFGWGLYFTESPKIAKHYQESLSGTNNPFRSFEKNWRLFAEKFPAEAEQFAKLVRDNEGTDTVSDSVLGETANQLLTTSGPQGWGVEMESLIRENFPQITEGGKTYEVRLKPSEDEYLEWDKPISEQSPVVQKAVEKLRPDEPTLTGAGLIRTSTLGQKELSQALRDAGVKGIKYPSGTFSGKKSSEISNYVIFDDSDIEIVNPPSPEAEQRVREQFQSLLAFEPQPRLTMESTPTPTPEQQERILQEAVATVDKRRADQANEVLNTVKQEHLNKLRERVGLLGVPEAERQSAADILARARAKGIPKRAYEIATEFQQHPRPWNSEETLGVGDGLYEKGERVQQLSKDHDAAKTRGEKAALRAQMDEEIAQMNAISDALYRTGTEQGRAMAVRQMALRSDFSFPNVMKRAKDIKEEPLTAEETSDLRKLTGRLERINKKRLDATPGSQREIDMDYLHERLRMKLQHKLNGMRPKTIRNRVGGSVGNAIDLWKTFLQSGDLVPLLRQGAYTTFAHPVWAAKTAPKFFQAFKNDRNAHKIEHAIFHHPYADLAKKAGLPLLKPDETLNYREDQAMSNLAHQLPEWSLLPKFNRAFRAWTNANRMSMFANMVDVRGGPTAMTEQALRTTADMIGIGTGRGGLGSLENASKGLLDIANAPRWVASRFQFATGVPYWRALLSGDLMARDIASKEYARFLLGASLGTLFFEQVAQFFWPEAKIQFHRNPLSKDFGKLQINNTRVDLSGGLALPVRLAASAADSALAWNRNRNIRYGKKVKPENDLPSTVGYAALSKLAPQWQLAWDLTTGELAPGQPTTLLGLVKEHGVPWSPGSVYDALREEGLSPGAAIGILDTFGGGSYQKQDRK